MCRERQRSSCNYSTTMQSAERGKNVSGKGVYQRGGKGQKTLFSYQIFICLFISGTFVIISYKSKPLQRVLHKNVKVELKEERKRQIILAITQIVHHAPLSCKEKVVNNDVLIERESEGDHDVEKGKATDILFFGACLFWGDLVIILLEQAKRRK